MDLMEARTLAQALMKQHELEFWNFEFDNAKRRFGSCQFAYRRITLSKHLVLLNDIDVVKNTILHEIAHALVNPNYQHNWVWREKAIEIGCDGKRCYNKEKVVPVLGRLIAKCPNCNQIFYRHRTPIRNLACGKCKELPFDKRLLNFTINKKLAR